MKNFNFFKKKRTPGEQLGISPNKAFLDETKANFLAAFDARYGVRPAPAGFMTILKIVAGAVAALAIVASVSVYADTRNVSADSSFYSFKRLREKVQLIFAPAAEKPQLQAAFAVRRADEITDLEIRQPSSTILPSLSQDLTSDINASITDEVNLDLGQGKASDFCAKFFSSIGSASSSAHDVLLLHPKVIQQFEDRCNQSNQNEKDGNNGNDAISGSVSSTVNAPGSIDGGRNNEKDGNGGNDLQGDSGKNLNSGLKVNL